MADTERIEAVVTQKVSKMVWAFLAVFGLAGMGGLVTAGITVNKVNAQAEEIREVKDGQKADHDTITKIKTELDRVKEDVKEIKADQKAEAEKAERRHMELLDRLPR